MPLPADAIPVSPSTQSSLPADAVPVTPITTSPQETPQTTQDFQDLLSPESQTNEDVPFQPSPLNPLQRAAVAFPKTVKGKIKEIQNLGFDPKTVGVDNNNNITIAGKPITPAVHGLWDLLSDSMGKIADNIPGSLPVLGQIGADLTAVGSGVGTAGLIGANAAGAAGGEAIRQGIANALTGESPSVGDLALNAGIGAITPPVAIGIGKAIQGTKQVLLDGMAKIASSGRADKFAAVAGQVLRNTDPDQVQFAIDTIRQKGADAILNPKVADENYAIDFIKNNFFGDDISKTIQTLSKANPQVVKNLYTGVLGIPDKEVNTLIQQGPSVYRMNNPGAMADLAENISKGISDPKTGGGLLDQYGKELGDARLNLIKQAGGVEAQGLTQTNAPLFQRLINLGMLKPESNGGFSIVKDWAGNLGTGKNQQKIFTDYLDRFSRTENMSASDLLARAGRGDAQAVSELANIRQSGQGLPRGVVKTYFPDNSLKYSEFAKKLGTFDTQISGHEFDAVGNMAPDLQQAVKGLRGVTLNVAKQVGDDNVPRLTKQFSQLSEDLGPLKQLVKSGNKSDIQSYLTKIAEEKDLPVQSANWSKLNALLKPKGINLLSDLNAYSASQMASKINTDEGKMKLLTSAQHIFDKAWDKSPLNDYIRTRVDAYLPSRMKILDNGKIHIVAKSLDKDARSLLKARFISTGVLGMAGLHAGGPLGAVAGMVGGFQAQDPRVVQALLKFAAARGTGVAGKANAVEVPRALTAVGLHKAKPKT